MRTTPNAVAIFAVLGGLATSAPSLAHNHAISSRRVTPLILEKNEGERRVWRPIEGAKGSDAGPGPFILKVDRHNGGSAHLVFGTEDLAPGASINRHRHPGADEILLLQTGRARVKLGDATRDVHGGDGVHPGEHLDFSDQYRARRDQLRLHLLGARLRRFHACRVRR
jgi:quercetin dioxygenase-like cupin family protein